MNHPKQLSYGLEARNKMLAGVDKLANAVKVTLGPGGRNVMIRRENKLPSVTKDGVSVAKAIFLKDPYEDLGAQMLKEVASKTADQAGDGTSSSVILAQVIANEGMKAVSSGSNPMSIKRGIDAGANILVQAISQNAVPVKTMNEIIQVATISGNNDPEIGQLIGTAIERVGSDGVITLEKSRTSETTLDVVEGMQISRGWQNPMFINDESTNSTVFNNALVVICEQVLSDPHELRVILNLVKDTRQMLFIVNDISEDSLGVLAMNNHGNRIKACVVKCPEMGEHRRAVLEDIAILTGGVVLNGDEGFSISTVTMEQLGQAGYIRVTRDATTIVEGGGGTEALNSRVEVLKSKIEHTESGFEIEKLKERVAKLKGGVAVIRVGGENEVAMGEKHDRLEDALCATRSAIAEGIVAGGGTALIRASESIRNVISEISKESLDYDEDEMRGLKIMIRACEEPLRQIVANVGHEGASYVDKVRAGEGNFGYNAKTDTFEDLFASGVIDPAKVTKHAIINSSSVAGLLLSTECLIVDAE